MTSTSPAAAARKNGVCPVRSTHDDGADDDEDEAPLVRILARARVRVRARFEQALDQRERFVANAAVVAVAAELEVAHVDGGPERRLAVPVRGVDVRAGVEQAAARSSNDRSCPCGSRE